MRPQRHPGFTVEQPDVNTCEWYTAHFCTKIEAILRDHDCVSTSHIEMSSAPSGPVILDKFQSVSLMTWTRHLHTLRPPPPNQTHPSPGS